MSYSKISSITLWVVAGLSLLVMLFFFVSPGTVDINELDARVLQLQTEGVISQEETPAIEADTTVTDASETANAVADEELAGDSAAIAATAEEMAPPIEKASIAPEEIDLKDYFSAWELMVIKRTDYALAWAYILFAIALIAAIVFPMINIATDKKAILKLLALLGGAAGLILLTYFVFASDQTIQIVGYTGTENSNPSVLKWIGSGLFITYIFFGMAILSILYSEIVKIFK